MSKTKTLTKKNIPAKLQNIQVGNTQLSVLFLRQHCCWSVSVYFVYFHVHTVHVRATMGNNSICCLLPCVKWGQIGTKAGKACYIHLIGVAINRYQRKILYLIWGKSQQTHPCLPQRNFERTPSSPCYEPQGAGGCHGTECTQGRTWRLCLAQDLKVCGGIGSLWLCGSLGISPFTFHPFSLSSYYLPLNLVGLNHFFTLVHISEWQLCTFYIIIWGLGRPEDLDSPGCSFWDLHPQQS